MPQTHRADLTDTLDNQLGIMSGMLDKLEATIKSSKELTIPLALLENISGLVERINRVRRHANTLDEEWRSLQALVSISQVINSSLELDQVLQIVMDTIVSITTAERGFLMLEDDQGGLVTKVARNWERESVEPSEFAISRTILQRVVSSCQPLLTTNASEDPRFSGQESIVAYNLRSILCVPMFVKEKLIGVIYADNRIRSGLFSQRDLDLLTAFANQAAVALENARLFASVRNTLTEVTELKSLMDNVFASIASGVITTDLSEKILLCNQAAENILGSCAENMVGIDLYTAFPPFAADLEPHIQQVVKSEQPVLGLEFMSVLSERGPVNLRFNISPLKDPERKTQGLAIVIEDMTEKKRLEASRRLFERMVSPRVIAQLDADCIEPGGQRAEISILFADIRGSTSFGEIVEPEELISVLNRYLAAAAEEILEQEGTIDKFLGDAVMAWFNAPVHQPDHTLRAVRSALAIRALLPELYRQMPDRTPLEFGFGIHVGEAVLGLVGTTKRMEYTAIGDSVNTAKRIQENAAPGQILISEHAYFRVADIVEAFPANPVIAKGKRDPIAVYSVMGIKPV